MMERIAETFGKPMGLQEVVEHIISEVRTRGDEALVDFEWRLDGVKLKRLEVHKKDISKARSKVDPVLASALELAAGRIRSFHAKCKRQSWVEFGEGGLGQWIRPLDTVGVYVPGGKAGYPSKILDPSQRPNSAE